MSQEDQIDWDSYGKGNDYGGMGNKEDQTNDEDFNNIRISLGDKKKSFEGVGYSKDAKFEDMKLDNKRKSEISTGDDSAEGKARLNDDEDLERRANRWCNCLHIDYYQTYFDVTTQDVVQRLLFSLIPFSSKLEREIGERPDFYGPFWIYTSLIFLLTFSENMHNYLKDGADQFKYNFNNVSPAFVTVYWVGFGVPMIIGCLMKYMTEKELKYKELTCIYGYSFTSICLFILICAVPVRILQIIAATAAIVTNWGVLFFNLKKELKEYAPKARWMFVIGLWLFQTALILMFKFWFFIL